MAKIEIACEETKGDPATSETIEVRVWGLGGTAAQGFNIGSGTNFNATGNIWLEIRYAVQGIPLFYTRNFLHHYGSANSTPQLESYLDSFVQGASDSFGFGDMLPETHLTLIREKYPYTDVNDEEQVSCNYRLTITADMGVVFGVEVAPGNRFMDIRLTDISLEDGERFMRDMIHEIDAAYHGKHPDPGCLPPGSSDWPFVRRLNQQVYDRLVSSYQERYFDQPLLAQEFTGWLALLPPGGHILDAGCGHGTPVIARLLEQGFQVTGTDFSPAMLRRANEQYPQVTFLQQAIAEISAEALYDGACSFSSMLYQDPIDLYHSIYRLHRALKPGGLLFLYCYDLHPGWRGMPYEVQMKQWMWSWTYGLDEAAQALEEHGYFEVLKAHNMITEDEKEKSIERWRTSTQKEYEDFVKDLPPGTHLPPLDLTKVPKSLPYPYVVIARRLDR